MDTLIEDDIFASSIDVRVIVNVRNKVDSNDANKKIADNINIFTLNDSRFRDLKINDKTLFSFTIDGSVNILKNGINNPIDITSNNAEIKPSININTSLCLNCGVFLLSTNKDLTASTKTDFLV